jgi:hypothetical protein
LHGCAVIAGVEPAAGLAPHLVETCPSLPRLFDRCLNGTSQRRDVGPVGLMKAGQKLPRLIDIACLQRLSGIRDQPVVCRTGLLRPHLRHRLGERESNGV